MVTCACPHIDAVLMCTVAGASTPLTVFIEASLESVGLCITPASTACSELDILYYKSTHLFFFF